MNANVQVTIAYLAFCHILLTATSPSYKHELARLGNSGRELLYTISFGWLGLQPDPSWRVPKTGYYASTDLLFSIQETMSYNQSVGAYTSNDLVAYMTATDAILGQGWKAHATLFVQLMSPRYTLLPVAHASLKPQLKMLRLAAADLPAVARLAGSEDASVGYRLSCSSPALSLGLGPQPFANCTVWAPAAKQQSPAATEPAEFAAAGSGEPAAVAETAAAAASVVVGSFDGCGMCPAAFGLYQSLQAGTNGDAATAAAARGACCPVASRHRRRRHTRPSRPISSSGTEGNAQQQQQQWQMVAQWTVMPTGADAPPAPTAPMASAAEQQGEGGASHEQEQQQQQLPLLGGHTFYEPPAGGFLSFMAWCDAWFVFPRTPLVQLLPSMTGLQQLVYAYAVALYTWHDLLHIISAMQQLHLRTRQADPFLGRSWSFATSACSLALQLLVLLTCRLVVSTLLAFAAVAGLYQLLRGVKFLSVLLQAPTLKYLALVLRLRALLLGKPAAAAAAAGAAAGAEAALGTATAGAAAAAAAAAGGAGSSSAVAATAVSSVKRGFWGFGSSNSAAALARAAGVDEAGTAAAAGLLRRLLLPWYPKLLAIHRLCEDLVLITCARLVWELQEMLFDIVWKVLALIGVEVQIMLESTAAGLAMLLQGASWRAAWARFSQLLQLQQRRRAEAAVAALAGHGNAAAGLQERVHAQVFIQAPADMGQAAEALRTLADELEQMGMHPAGWAPGSGTSRRRVQLLGQHWPAPLELPFDAEEVQTELGVEVPRGFICPITQDIMKLPALLISSTVAVPATYDRDAIARWLEDNRRDPKSRQMLSADAQLVPNMDLYRSIEDWVAEKQQQRQRQAAAAVADVAAEPAPVPAGAAEYGPRPQQPSSSANALCGSLLAAVRGVAAGTAAAAVAAAGLAGQRRQPQSQGHGYAAAAAAAGGDDDYDEDDSYGDDDGDADGPLLSEEEEEVTGPAAPVPAARATGRAAMQMLLGMQQHERLPRRGPGMWTGGRPTHRPASPAVSAGAAAGASREGDTASGAVQDDDVFAEGDAAAVAAAARYNLRRRRGSTPSNTH